jgi:hypothetical protein
MIIGRFLSQEWDWRVISTVRSSFEERKNQDNSWMYLQQTSSNIVKS